MNKYKPNLQILCEDRINQDIARGFILGFYNDFKNPASIEVCRELARGWCKAVNSLHEEWVQKLQDNENLFLLVLIDSDGKLNRILEIKSRLPKNLINRIFIIGCLNEPEELKKQAVSFIKADNPKEKQSNEAVGKILFKHCKDKFTNNLWNSCELEHNFDEIIRLKQYTKHFIDWDS